MDYQSILDKINEQIEEKSQWDSAFARGYVQGLKEILPFIIDQSQNTEDRFLNRLCDELANVHGKKYSYYKVEIIFSNLPVEISSIANLHGCGDEEFLDAFNDYVKNNPNFLD